MRIIGHGRKVPFVVKLGDLPGIKSVTSDEKVLKYELHMCACGLSKNKPFCDGSHKHVSDEEEGKIFSYTGEDKREEVKVNGKEGREVKIVDRYE